VKNMSKDDDVVDAAKAYTLPVDPLPPTTNEDAF
jgi:hypothetical protein